MNRNILFVLTAILCLFTTTGQSFANSPTFAADEWGGTSTGSANAQAITVPNLLKLSAGVQVTFKAGYTSTAAATLAVNSFGPIAMSSIAGAIQATHTYRAIYSGTAWLLRDYSAVRSIDAVGDFGADPTGGADSSTAFNNFFTACGIAGVDCYIPGGNYTVNGNVLFDCHANTVAGGNGWHIHGAGPHVSLLTFGAGYYFQVYNSTGGVGNSGACWYGQFDNFGIVTNIAAAGFRLGDELGHSYMNGFLLSNMWFQDTNHSTSTAAIEFNGFGGGTLLTVTANAGACVDNYGNCIGNGDAARLVQVGFSTIQLDTGHAENGIHITSQPTTNTTTYAAAASWTTSSSTITMGPTGSIVTMVAGQPVTDTVTGLTIGSVLSWTSSTSTNTTLTLKTNAKSNSSGSTDSLRFDPTGAGYVYGNNIISPDLEVEYVNVLDDSYAGGQNTIRNGTFVWCVNGTYSGSCGAGSSGYYLKSTANVPVRAGNVLENPNLSFGALYAGSTPSDGGLTGWELKSGSYDITTPASGTPVNGTTYANTSGRTVEIIMSTNTTTGQQTCYGTGASNCFNEIVPSILIRPWESIKVSWTGSGGVSWTWTAAQ